MNHQGNALRLSALLLLTLFFTAAKAEETESCADKTETTYEARLGSYWAGHCYLSLSSYRQLSALTKQKLSPASGYSQRSATTLAATDAVVQESKRLGTLLSTTGKALLDELQQQATESYRALEAWEPKAQVLRDLPNWGKNTWTPNQQGNQTWEAVKTTLIGAGCFDTAMTEACEVTYADALAASGLLFAMRDITWYYLEPDVDQQLNDYRLNVNRWDSYLNDMQFQYPWELLLNYCYDNQRLNENKEEFARWQCFVPVWGSLAVRKHLHNQPDTGFVPPPDRRWIFLHPELALAYSEDQSSGDKFTPALNFEWLGRYFYSYDDAKGRIRKPMGVSIVSTFADLPDSRNHGIGLMAHYKDFALSVTRHSGDTVISLNLNLLKTFENLESDTVKKLKGKFERLTKR